MLKFTEITAETKDITEARITMNQLRERALSEFNKDHPNVTVASVSEHTEEYPTIVLPEEGHSGDIPKSYVKQYITLSIYFEEKNDGSTGQKES